MEDRYFSALVVTEDTVKGFHSQICQQRVRDLPAGDVLIRVRYSSLNYKDALSASGNRGITRHYPHTPGIDAAGVVEQSLDSQWHAGDEVICSGYDLGMNTSGGYGQYIRVPGNWLVRKPQGLSLKESMQLGTAGFTAAQCLLQFEHNNIFPDVGPVLVTGATGGVGSVAILLLHKLGYEVTALTGKTNEHTYLTELGATTILERQDFQIDHEKLLLPARWAGVVDTVGGDILASAIKGTAYDGVVASCGNAASGDLPLSVYPFILRGVHLVGIYSAQCPMARRQLLWERLANDWKLPELPRISRLIPLSTLHDEIRAMLAGQNIGRCVVDMEATS